MQVNVSGEAAKKGFPFSEAMKSAERVASLPNLELKGLMTIAPLAAEAETARSYFRRLRQLRDALGLKDLSMGMTNDFEAAVEGGATILRIGRAVFGERRPD